MTEIIASMGVYDYGKNKLCDLYDSQNNLRGQAYNITFRQSMADGIHTLTFSIPYMVENEENFRWEYLKNEYLIRLKFNGQIMWYIATKPVKSKSGKEIVGTVTCQGLEALLKTRNIYMEFDDTNGIGTVDELTDKVLAGTGWSRGYTDPMLESDGATEKVRSITSGGKDGALGLISKISNVFKCFPVYDSENMTVALYNFNNREQVLEGVVGYNLNALTVTPDSASMITRMYVEGEYGDNGYVGIDDVNPTGLNYLMNFDYYREIGVMTNAQEQALAKYISDISAVKGNISRNAALITQAEDEINNLIGQCNVTLYYTSTGFVNNAYTYGDPTDAQKALSPGSKVIVLNENGTYRTEIVESSPQALIQDGDYGIAKFGTPAAGIVGGKEVQVEAKEKQIASLTDKISRTDKQDKIDAYNAEIDALETGINDLYEAEADGLYVLMSNLFKHGGMMELLHDLEQTSSGYGIVQDNIESEFIVAIGPLLRDGYWSNQNYVPGQEEALYNDAIDVMKEMSRPATSYTFDYVRIMDDFGIPMEDIRLNAIFKIHDDELKVHENLFITDIVIGVDDLSNGTIEVSNRDITLNTNDLGALLSRMSQLADMIEQKNTLYERAKAISKNGTLYADRLNGQINVLKNQIISTVSNWYTDDNGNIVFEAADGGSAMMLSGAGFMIAGSKTEDGEWNWRTFGSGEGFTADEIIAGFLSADRIEAGTISTAKITPDFGDTLVITNNPSITGIQAQIDVLPDELIATVKKYGRTYIQLTDPTLDDDKVISVGDLWMIGDPDGLFTWGDAGGLTNYDLMQMHNAGTLSGYKDVYCWDGEKWVYVFDTALAGDAFARVDMTEAKLEMEVARTNALEGSLMTRMSQTATDIKLEAQRATTAEGQLNASININAEAITSEVQRASTAEGTLGSRITQTADSLTTEVTRATTAEGTLSSRITQTATSLTSEITRASTAEGTLSSRITQTATSLTSEITRASNAEGTLSSRITQTATSLSSEITRASAAEGTLSSRITQTATSISSEITRASAAEGTLSSRITQTATDITLGTITAGAVQTTSSTVVIGQGGISMKTGATFTVESGNFSIDNSGNVSMTGTINASAGGTIGGWYIGSDFLGSGNTTSCSIGLRPATNGTSTTQIFWAGYDSSAAAGSRDTFYVRKDGYVFARSGQIGGWTLGTNLLSSGSETGYVALDSNTSDTYAIWAGNATASSAPFRVKRDGTVSLTKLEIIGENGSTTTANLSSSNYPLWKLYGLNVKTASVSDDGKTLTITPFTGSAITFNKASGSVTKLEALEGTTYDLSGNTKYANVQVKASGDDITSFTSAVKVDITTGWSDGYTAGRGSVTQRTVSSGTKITLLDTNTGTSTKSTTLTFSDDTHQNLSLEVDASNVFGAVKIQSWGTPSYTAGGVNVTITLTNGKSYSHFYAE